MRNHAHPWLASNIWLVLLSGLPAVFMILALLYFTGWAITFSFSDLAFIGPKSINWRWVGFANYESLISRRGFLEALWTTIVFTFFSAIIGQSTIGFLAAALMRNMRSRVRSVAEVALMLGWLLPDIVAAFLWSATASDNGLLNTLFTKPFGLEPINFLTSLALPLVIIANVWKGTAWSYLLFSAALDSVSKEVTEAATVDGANAFQRITRVVLPIIRPHIATNMLFITIWTFTYFPLIYAMTGGGPGRQTEVLAVFLYNQSFNIGKLGYGSAISVAMMLVVGALSLIYLRLLREPK